MLVKGCIHARAHDLHAICNDQSMSIPFDLFRDGFVFHDLVFYSFMTTDGIINTALDQDKLSIGDGITTTGVIKLCEERSQRRGQSSQAA